MRLFKEFTFGDICLQYWQDREDGNLSFEMLPNEMQNRRQEKRQAVDPCVQLMVRGDDFPFGFANGHTMRNCGSVSGFRYDSQHVKERDGFTEIITTFKNKNGLILHHTVDYQHDMRGITVKTVVYNNGQDEITLDMISSVNLSGLTPFVAADAPGSLVLHRMRSKWSNEGRLETIPIESLQLEPTWSGHGAFSEKYGQAGSMPVRRFFPFAAVEDTVNHVVWGMQLCSPSSWQIELYRKDDGLCLSGGLADYDFGHWCKVLWPGECFAAPPAYVTVCQGSLDEACTRLVDMQSKILERISMPTELPVVFNEFCTTWGEPSKESIERMLTVLKGRDIDYFVIDSGWYADEAKGWEMNMGDWQVNTRQFPEGLSSVARLIKDAGMRPGIWFEPEVCGSDAAAFRQTDHLLKRFGIPITAGFRRFWDMRDPWVKDYLEEKVIGLMKECGFEYIKIDYNETIGIGCDGAESLGEGLRQSVEASRSFLVHLRHSIPGLMVENCSSGGHRLEPSLLGVCQLASFSDAHEEKEIPIIAANLHRLMPPRQSLIWAVLRKDDSSKRLVWSLCATFLGVMCLSGDVHDLSGEQWAIVEQGIAFYRSISPLIRQGTTARFGPEAKSYRHPDGWQAVVRTASGGNEKLLVVHVFDAERVGLSLEIGDGYAIQACFSVAEEKITLSEGKIQVQMEGYAAFAVHLRRN